jgi:hypothetical protein
VSTYVCLVHQPTVLRSPIYVHAIVSRVGTQSDDKEYEYQQIQIADATVRKHVIEMSSQRVRQTASKYSCQVAFLIRAGF